MRSGEPPTKKANTPHITEQGIESVVVRGPVVFVIRRAVQQVIGGPILSIIGKRFGQVAQI